MLFQFNGIWPEEERKAIEELIESMSGIGLAYNTWIFSRFSLLGKVDILYRRASWDSSKIVSGTDELLAELRRYYGVLA